jgi:Na+/H+ antiporter NhaD/arsenite permease-like protein
LLTSSRRGGALLFHSLVLSVSGALVAALGKRFVCLILLSIPLLFLGCGGAWAEGSRAVDGAHLSLRWVIPFAGVLASLAVFPLIAPHFWHRRYGLVALFWGTAFLAPFAAKFGFDAAFHTLVHALLVEYIPFIALIASLFAIAGGIYVGGELNGSPRFNCALLAVGTLCASLTGTTGAAMILIRPLIRANEDRTHKVHLVVFFIFLVCNIGGALTPLGDPPLFLGYLEGVAFFWPLKALWPHMLFLSALLLAVFFALDSYLWRKERSPRAGPGRRSTIVVRGAGVNLPLLALLVVTIAVSGADSFGTVAIFGTEIEWIGLVRDGILALLGVASIVLTPKDYRNENEFAWAPVIEVAKLFAAIFLTIAPAIAILKAGHTGAFASLLALLGGEDAPNTVAYFWLTGLLSSFLDNAPTYLVFFNAAGGDPHALMGPMAQTLTAISAGAVFMGANTYVGNAPNFMVKAIAEHQGVRMPSFFGFMLWSGAFLLPAFALLTLLFFR